jgi:RsiW-degrading membrane proteinase PrsW (M82 family)
LSNVNDSNGKTPKRDGEVAMDFHEKRAEDLGRLKAELRAVRLKEVIPLAVWWKDQPWNLLWVRWFLAYALFPFVLLHTIDQFGFGGVTLSFGVYFALTWLIVLTLCMRPERIDAGLLLGVSAFTAIIGVAVVLVAQQLPLIKALYDSALSDPLQSPWLVSRWFGFVFGVGLIEEATKALPVYLFVYRKARPYRPLNYAYVGIVSGLAFGVIEGVAYSYRYAEGLRRGGPDLIGVYIVVQLLRLISLPLLHACWSAVVGYFIGLASIHRQAPRVLMGIGLLLAAVLHGTYDTFDGWFGVLVSGLTILVFISYVRSGDQISQEITKEVEGAEPTILPLPA